MTRSATAPPIVLERMEFPEPVIHVAIEPKTKSDQEKLGGRLKSLSDEDPTFRVRTDDETGQTVISGMGELHLEVLVDRMMRSSCSCPGSRTWPASRATSPSRASPGRTARARSSATSSPVRGSRATSSRSAPSSSTSSSSCNEDGSIEIADKLDTLEKPCYDMAGLTRQYEFLTTVSRYCNELGWGNYANDHEDANGQFEQNFEYADALVTCDRAIFFRYMVHTLAEQHGMQATFMPKPFTQSHRERLPLPHVALEGRRERLPRRGRPARARPLASSATRSSAA